MASAEFSDTKLTIDELRRQERLKKQEERKMKELQMVKKLHVSTAEAEEEKRIQAAITEEKERYKKKHLSRWERRFCGCFVSLDKDEQVWREEEKKKEEELMADMSYEEKQQYRKDKKWKKSIGYKIHKFKKKYFFWMRYPRIDDLFVPYRTVKWLYSKCGIPRPVIRFALWSVKTGESIATWWGLRFAKVYFGLKVVYKALSNFVSGAAQYDYDDLAPFRCEATFRVRGAASAVVRARQDAWRRCVDSRAPASPKSTVCKMQTTAKRKASVSDTR